MATARKQLISLGETNTSNDWSLILFINHSPVYTSID